MKIVILEDGNLDAVAREAADALKMGGIVIYPTDTLYGIGVNALDESALAKLRRLKVREQKKPMSILVPSVEHISRYGHMTDAAKEIAERHLPGGLTLILPATEHAPRDITLNDAIGIRVPGDAFSLALAEMFDGPVTATSANRAGLTTPSDIRSILEHFGPDIEHLSIVVDGGERSGGTPSTVISFVHGDIPRILREGVITREELGL
ncbi:MAG: threonylcarbamoyl-AMP synthase [Candidatus Pacebacteria bacterium]|nr:threonylcarbamoyl-AMP synthase [Candidatus Paceibacterota bacterium]